MIWLPGFLSQGGKKYVWTRYAIAYGEKAGTAATVSRTYNKSKYASAAYTIQNGVFVLTNPVATTFENLTAGKRTVDMADSTNAVSSGGTLYKVTGNGGRDASIAEEALDDYTFTYTTCAASVNYTIEGSVFVLAYENVSVQKMPSGIYKWTDGASWYDEVFSTLSTVGMGTPPSSEGTTIYGFTATRKSGTTNYVTRKKYTLSMLSTLSITYTPYTVSTTRGDLIDTVTDADPAAYPENGIQDGYWYVLQ